jgi:hypothetical protein
MFFLSVDVGILYKNEICNTLDYIDVFCLWYLNRLFLVGFIYNFENRRF